jgi:hypothetical protein
MGYGVEQAKNAETRNEETSGREEEWGDWKAGEITCSEGTRCIFISSVI